MKPLFTSLLLILFTASGMAQEKPACSVTQISTVAEWQRTNSKLPFKGSADTKLMVTMRCPDKRKLVDLPDDSWSAYGRAEILIPESFIGITAMNDLKPITSAVAGKGGTISLPADIFIRLLQGETESVDVRGTVFYALTGCPWGRPGQAGGELDSTQCVRVR